MKNRFVLGIVLVLCLQVAFQVLIALEQARDRYFHARVTTVPSPTDPSPVVIASIPDAGEDLGSGRRTELPIMAEHRAAAIAAQSRSPRTERKPHLLFETITITYPGRPAVPAAPRISMVARTERPEKEERSFFARAVVPVVKKPYELIKLVGSKLR